MRRGPIGLTLDLGVLPVLVRARDLATEFPIGDDRGC
jgi:hypothetical protein